MQRFTFLFFLVCVYLKAEKVYTQLTPTMFESVITWF